MKTLTAVLFAGGESRRMGRDKATLLLNGEPLWARQLRVLRELSPEAILISARARPIWCPTQIEVVLDVPPSRGPLSGLAAALKRIQTTHLLAFAVDLPEMTSTHLKKLWSLANPGIGVVPQNGIFPEPLSAIYPVEGLRAVELTLATNDASMQGVIRRLTSRKQIYYYQIKRSERAAYENVNAAEQWNQRATTHSPHGHFT
ncbi:MAG: molybdenum cofactor guanylyltransferase [Verrucomicrobia bacterium]|nr:molybdenum cofactor guanylyltransferase [Verrucomicrobiota bacterium]MDE3099861.1 molybdenum cofactor guanylyltransferase [Verrucomicrobiota bacterium]